MRESIIVVMYCSAHGMMTRLLFFSKVYRVKTVDNSYIKLVDFSQPMTWLHIISLQKCV